MDANLAGRLNEIGSLRTLVLTHTGRKSGKPYDVVIWFVAEGDRIYLGTANRNRQWVRNVIARPNVTIKAGDQKFEGTVREITEPGERAHVMELVQRKYWYAAPFLVIGRLAQAMGLIQDNTGTFEVILAAGA